MKKILIILFLFVLTGCAAKYEVIQKVRVNMYHLVNTRTKEVEIILTSDELTEGQILKKNKIKIIVEIEK
jgi:uncharacterized protein YcfL